MFFEVEALMAECPNLTPISLGKNSTPVDTSSLCPQTPFNTYVDVPGLDLEPADGAKISAKTSSDKSMSSESSKLFELSDEDEPVTVVPSKHTKGKAKKSAPPSQPAPAAVKHESRTSKGKSTLDHFADATSFDAEVAQSALQLKAVKSKGLTTREIAKVQAKADVQKTKLELQMKFELEKYKIDHEMQTCEQLSSSFPSSSLSTSFPSTLLSNSFPSASLSSSHQGSSTPSSIGTPHSLLAKLTKYHSWAAGPSSTSNFS